MNSNHLRQLIHSLVPYAIAWAQARASEIQADGAPLDSESFEIASRVGVVRPDRVRIAYVDHIPVPEDLNLRTAAISTGLLGANTAGLTLGYSIYICGPNNDRHLLSHELRHVHQYEQAGGIAEFLNVYLKQIAEYGYDQAPLEIDARMYELNGLY